MATYTKHLPDGTTVVLSQAEYDAEVASRTPAQPPRPAPVFRVSKDKLTRALVAAGKYEAFVAARNATPDYARELWLLEPTFRTDDPFILQFLPAIEAALALSPAQVADLLWACRA